MNNEKEFDRLYLNFVSKVKAARPKCRIALVSVQSSATEFTNVVENMNRHIHSIADAEKCVFVNLDNAKFWKLDSTKAALDFAYGMGLSVRKPLSDVAEIVYGYAYEHNVLQQAPTVLVS